MSNFHSISCLTLLICALDRCLMVQAAYSHNYLYMGYYPTYYTASDYVSIGAIIGSVIGALSFIGFIIGIVVCVCCMRRRRLAQQQPGTITMAAQVPMTSLGAAGPTVATVSGGDLGYPKQDGLNYYGGGAPQPTMPPPYPTAEAAGGPHVNNGYQQWPVGATPYPTAGVQPPLYPPPGYQQQQPQMQPNLHVEQRF